MICPECNRSCYASQVECPSCGAELAPEPPERKPAQVILKTSTILISSEEAEGVYRSVQDVPERLRKMLLQSTSGLNSGTILIADQRGREQILNAFRKLPQDAQQQLRELTGGAGFGALQAKSVLGVPLARWAVIATVLLIITITVFIWIYHW